MKKDYLLIGIAGAVIGVLAVILVKLGNPPNMGFCIACFERDIAGALGLHQPWKMAWLRPEIIGIVLGAFLAALITKEFKPKGGSAPIGRFVAGMFVMIGALVFLGCPLRMTLRLAGGDLNALVALFGFVVGILAGVYFLKSGFDFGRANPQKSINGLTMPVIMATLLLFIIFIPQFKEGGPIFVGKEGHIGAGENPSASQGLGIAISLLAGILVGVFAQRTRLCLAGGIRDIFLTKSTYLVTGFVLILLSAFLGNVVVGRFHLSFENQPIAHTKHLWNFLGMMLVGLGSVMLGGCPLRQLVLSGEGNADSALTVLGMIVGAAFSHNFALTAASTPYSKWAVAIGFVALGILGLLSREK